MRSQDVLHSAYIHFRAQMNCVPGMVTKFAFYADDNRRMRETQKW
jgi:heme/copper-type cytochrome/quinol oxidase subunit 2